ncbi:hypothetical protein [Aurantimicrobium minutum]|uniref:hypothetical protein n=1 Tax=Aurantimicrobium minutum TaxID=708131 RepID=UPI0024751A94|nr:hypothetical protein [Aurantimicrobium minutum]
MSTAVKKNAGRAWISAVLLIVAMVLTPVAIVAHWATSEVTNTERFVSTLSPLASNPEVQQVIIDEVTGLITEQVDIPEITDSLFTGLGKALNLPEKAQKALDLLVSPVANGVDSLITNVVTTAVESEAFQKAWTKTLTLTQEQTVALLSGDPDSMLQLSNDGTLSLPLKPLIVEIKATLVKQGVGFASAIPEVDKSIVLGQIPELALARVIYQVGVGVGTWLPWIVAGLFAAGIGFARKRPRAILATSVVFAVLMAFLAFLFGSGRIVATTVIDPGYSAAVGVVYDALVSYVVNVVAALGLIAIFTAIAAWAFSTSETAEKFRGFANKQINTVRSFVDPENARLGAATPVLHKYRIVARVIILGGVALILTAIQPATIAAVIWLGILALVLLFVYEVLQRATLTPVVVAPAAPATKTTAAAKKPATAAKKPVAKKPAAKKS